MAVLLFPQKKGVKYSEVIVFKIAFVKSNGDRAYILFQIMSILFKILFFQWRVKAGCLGSSPHHPLNVFLTLP